MGGRSRSRNGSRSRSWSGSRSGSRSRGQSARQSGVRSEARADLPPRVPITLLTGFLGAGKTSRLNASLAESHEKIAVIENEIGSLGVDGALVANTHDDGVIELTNGCLCCSAEVDLVHALETLAHRRRARPFDRVVIETTGLADVAPVVALLSDEEDHLSRDFLLDGVVTVVDAACFRSGNFVAGTSGFGLSSAGLATGSSPSAGPSRATAVTAFWRQIALADQVILSKEDLVSEVADVREAVQTANPLAEVLEGMTSLPPLRGRARLGVPIGRWCRRGSTHLDGVDVLTLRVASLLWEAPLRELAQQLLAGRGDLGEAWRVKGLVGVEGKGVVLVQGTGDQVALEPWSAGVAVPFLVVIGAGLCQELIEAMLAECATGTTQGRIEAAA